MKIICIIINGIVLCLWLANAAPTSEQLMSFRPVTKDQYNAIVGFTRNATNNRSEGRLMSGLAALRGITEGFRSAPFTSWLPNIFANFAGTQRNATNNMLELEENYPLCVVNQQENDSSDFEDESDDDIGRDEQMKTKSRIAIVKCMVVVKGDQRGAHKRTTASTTTTTTTTRPPEISYPQYTHENYNYQYPPWYNNLYNYPQHYPNPYQNEEMYPQYNPHFRYDPNTYENSDQNDYYQYYSKPHRSQHAYRNEHERFAETNRERHPKPINFNDYAFQPRIKRHQHSKHSHQQNYAKISNYPEGGYQPAAYPKINYHSQYPKVTYSSYINSSSPVYVRNMLPQEIEDYQE